jgi:hypothetical protein
MIKEYQLQKKQNSFEVTLHYKGVQVRVAFTGGNVYKGTMPRFRTNDLFKMKAIEASELFRTKEVVVLRTIQESTSKPPVVVQRKRVGIRTATKAAQVTKPAPKAAPSPAPETPVEPETPQDSPVDENETKEFSNLGEAILYIAQNWQLTATTDKEARDILKAHGINPRIKKG